MKTSLKLITPLILLSLLLTACGQPANNAPKPEKPSFSVKGQTVGQSRTSKKDYEYPALVSGQQEAKVIAKVSGTIKQMNFKSGDKVKAGSLLARIDDISQGGSPDSSFSANQIRQAQLAVEQAEINKRNIVLTSAESLKNAQISYETAKIATEQARLNLENRQAGINQSSNDAATNAEITANSVADLCGSLITEINNLAGYDDETLDQQSAKFYLGLANPQLAAEAKDYYKKTIKQKSDFVATNFTDIKSKIEATISLAQTTKKLIEFTSAYLKASVTSSVLAQTTLNAWQTAVSGYLTQINTALSQINGAKQALANNDINSTTNSDALTKAYELAEEQEKSAAQALRTQEANIKSMLDSADLGYRNALLALQSLIDIHSLIAPLSGEVTQNFIAAGDTVSAGELLATISSGESYKFQFYVDESVNKEIRLDQAVIIKNNTGKKIPGKITSLASQADVLTKRFLTEVEPINYSAEDFSLGTIADIVVTVEKKSESENIILPLSVLDIGQNGNNLFISSDGLAKKVPVEIIKITGETAEVKTDLPDSAVIITDGNKLIQDGDRINLILQ